MSAKDVKSIVNVLQLNKLFYLNLRNNCLDNECIKMLAVTLQSRNLNYLKISYYNKIVSRSVTIDKIDFSNFKM